MEHIQKLEIRGVSRRFGATTALYDFTLDINGGMFVALLGPSGCGKSTALNCLAGLLDLSEGEIILNGKPVQGIAAEKRGFGMVFQNYALFPHLSVARNVGYGLEIRGVAKAERESRVERALKRVHLEAFANRFPAQLSGGQQQRLAIARTIVLEPSLLLLDEPLSNLDTKLRNEMRIEIKRLHDQLGLTTVYVTHDQSEAMSMADLVVVMRLGHIEQIGPPQEIYNRPRSLYVADFMGYANRMSVDLVEQQENNTWLVRTATGTPLRATCTLAPDVANLRLGQRATVCFRPDEGIVGATSPDNQLQGQVQLVEYMGKSFEALVKLDDENQTQVLVQSQYLVNTGDTVKFAIRPDRLLLFPAYDGAEPMNATSADVNDSALALNGKG